jgi:hypothetical protein
MMSYPRCEGSRTEAFQAGKIDRTIARSLSLAEEPSRGGAEFSDPLTVQSTLEQGRCISRNLRRLLVRGGICVRVEYATTRRHEWSALELQQVSFEEGTLDMSVDGVSPRKWFRVLASAYFRSRVLETLSATGDKRDRNRGLSDTKSSGLCYLEGIGERQCSSLTQRLKCCQKQCGFGAGAPDRQKLPRAADRFCDISAAAIGVSIHPHSFDDRLDGSMRPPDKRAAVAAIIIIRRFPVAYLGLMDAIDRFRYSKSRSQQPAQGRAFELAT